MAIKRKSRPKAKPKAKARKVAPKRKAVTSGKRAAKPKAAPKPRAARAKPKAAPKRKAARAKPQPAAPAEPGQRIGAVTHFYGHLGVAIVKLTAGTLRVGDTVHIRGHTSDFRQVVQSLQVEHAQVGEARAGDEFGLKVTEHAREHDVVYRVTDA